MKKKIEMYHHQLKEERLKKDKNFNIDFWHGYSSSFIIDYNKTHFTCTMAYVYVILLDLCHLV